jgi:hypothetical protein
MTRRTGIEVRLGAVAQRLRGSHGFCPVSITTPFWVRIIPLFDSKPRVCERDFSAAKARVKEDDTP